MAQIPILDGIFTDEAGDYRQSYPVNMVPVPKQTGIANGYIRPADGIAPFGVGPGVDRGGINWRGQCYRVMGTQLIRVLTNGAFDLLGDVGGLGPVRFTYSFDRLAIASSGKLYYWDGATLSQVTDPDLGLVLDVVWIDGYFLTTDGDNLVVTELNDPFAVDPLKYGSSEVDPDPVKAVLKVQDEVYALNRHTIEVFDNVGGEGFPFQRIEGALIAKGILGPRCACTLDNLVVFLGSGRNEAPALYFGANGQATKVSTREVDQILAQYTEAELANSLLETRIDRGHQHIWLRLPDRTLVFDPAATEVIGKPAWFVLTAGLDGFQTYPGANLVWCYDRWIVGDPNSARLGVLDESISTQHDAPCRWEFGTLIVYNEGRGALFSNLELVCLTGRVAFGADPRIATSYSKDGETWSQERSIRAGKTGDRSKRLVWFQQGFMRHWRIQRFRGTSDAHLSITRLEAALEPLAF